MKKRILVTGINGFIGQNVAHELCHAHRILGVGVQPETKHEYAYAHSDFSRASLQALVAEFSPDVVVHCAGKASVQQALIKPEADFDSGPVLLFNLYNALREANSHAFVIQLSSAAVYGNPESLPVAETHQLKPISSYGWHKLMGESLGQEFSLIYGIHGFALRIFSCYGDGQQKLLLWDAANKIQSGKPAFFGTGEETRDYLHIEDLARLVALLVGRGNPGVFSILNAASGKQQSVSTTVTMLQKAMGAETLIPTFTNTIDPGAPRFWQADITRLKELGFSPQISFENGVKRYANWFATSRKSL